jgi:predicted MFS family arabinose efflux permease
MLNPWRGLDNLPREVWILFFTTLINRAGAMAMPFLALYLTRSHGWTAGRVGFVITVYGIGALITSPLAGKLCDQVGALRIMKASLLLAGIVLLIFPLAHSFAGIVGLIFLWAVVSEAFRPASMVVNTEMVSPERRKAAVALYRLAANLGMSIGPAAGGFLAAFSFTWLFVVDGITAILAGLFLSFSGWKEPRRQISSEDAKASESVIAKRRGVFTDRVFLWFFVAMIPVEMVFFQHTSTMPLFLTRDLHLSETAFGLLFSLNTLLIVFLEVWLNTATERWPHKWSMALGALLTAIGFGAQILVTGITGVALTIIIWTLGEMILFPGTVAYVAEIAAPQKRGAYLGVFQMTFSLSFALGPWIGTQVYERYGAGTLWLSALLCGLLSAAMLAQVSPRKPEPLTQTAL